MKVRDLLVLLANEALGPGAKNAETSMAAVIAKHGQNAAWLDEELSPEREKALMAIVNEDREQFLREFITMGLPGPTK